MVRSGLTGKKYVYSSLCKNSLAGDDPVVACIVLLQDRRKFWTLCCSKEAGSDAEDSRECLKKLPNRSAKWFGETMIWGWMIQSILSMQFSLRNSSYSADWHGGPLLLTISTGWPYLAKMLQISLAVTSVVVVFWPLKVSIHHNEGLVWLIGGKVYVYLLPRNCRLRPWKQW